MDTLVLQERIARVQAKRELLRGFKAYPNLGSVSQDIDRALSEMDNLMAEFQKAYPNGVLTESTDKN